MRNGRFVHQLPLVTLLLAFSWSVVACAPPPEREMVPETPMQEEREQLEFAQWAEGVTDLNELNDRWVWIVISGPVGSRNWKDVTIPSPVCKTPKAGCGNVVTWKRIGVEIDATLRIERKEGQGDCFEVVEIPPNPSSATVNPGPDCPIGPWHYRITCEPASSGECPPEPLDPRIEIED